MTLAVVVLPTSASFLPGAKRLLDAFVDALLVISRAQRSPEHAAGASARHLSNGSGLLWSCGLGASREQ